LSDNTVKVYARNVQELFDLLRRRGVNINDFRSIGQAEINIYLAHIVSHDASKATQSSKIASLKSFFGFLKSHDYIESSPFGKIRTPKLEKRLPNVVTQEKMQQMLDQANYAASQTHDLADLQQAAILELFYASGVRISELTELKLQHVNFEEMLIRVRGKGDKERVVPFGKKAKVALQNLLEQQNVHLERNQEENADRLMFLRLRVQKGTATPKLPLQEVSQTAMRKMIRNFSAQFGIENVHPHTFRHTFATHLLDEGVDIRVVQELVGHASLATTQKYTHTSREKLLKVYSQAFPRA
jgi:integrase/recombinase XerC